ncbi:MAG: HD domain-containing protein [Oligoflexia bacterium]|nr:HD domain-containing protein [Oligoflexia bacterium]
MELVDVNLDIPRKTNVKTIEVRDVIHGSIELYPWELAIIDSFAFQRLRNIKQLGFSEFAYPCAVHNRYVHSIGAAHLAGVSFRAIFKEYFFSNQETYHNFYYLTRAAALLHDIGHGPFSHAVEYAMPKVSTLQLPKSAFPNLEDRKASHEDYTLKIILDSSLTKILEKEYGKFGITPTHIASAMNLDIPNNDSFFKDRGVDFRKVLHQIISSEMDADRMDYLQRDSYYSGVSYGKFDANWILSNLGVHIENKTAYMSLNERAIYTFEDFLLSRYHMFLMVYLHHKSVCYEEMMKAYMRSEGVVFKVPSDVEEYLECDDNYFYECLKADQDVSPWAERILKRKNFKVALELHESSSHPENRPEVKELIERLKSKNIEFLIGDSGPGLSKYARPNLGAASPVNENTIFVKRLDRSTKSFTHQPLEEVTDLFRKYAEKKYIYRIYTPENAKF